MKTLAFTPALQTITAAELEFHPVSTSAIQPLKFRDDSGEFVDSFALMDMLVKSLEEQVGLGIEKFMFFMTPEQPTIDHLGFLFLQNRSILPIKIDPSENYLSWYRKITKLDTGNEFEYVNFLITLEGKSGSISRRGIPGFGPKYQTYEEHFFFQEIGKKLFEAVPNSFKTEDLVAEKEAYLKPFLKLSSASSPSLEEIQEALSKFGELDPPHADLAAFKEEFETTTGFSLPAELKALLSITNGSKTSYIDYYHLLPAKDILREWKSWKEIFDEWTLEELKSHDSDEDKSLPMYTTPYWIPFMSDDNGNHKALDFAPGPKGKPGQIISFGADEQLIEVLAEDLATYLKNLPQ